MKNSKKFKRGFSLLELLVVILIIGILAAIALPQYNMAVMKSRFAVLMDMVRVMNDAEERYYMVHDKYSDTYEGLDMDLSGCTLSDDKKKCNYTWGNCEINTYSGAGRLDCYNNTSLKNAYAQYLKQGSYAHYGRACIASTMDVNDKYNRLCKNMGTVSTWSDYCYGIGSCMIYKF